MKKVNPAGKHIHALGTTLSCSRPTSAAYAAAGDAESKVTFVQRLHKTAVATLGESKLAQLAVAVPQTAFATPATLSGSRSRHRSGSSGKKRRPARRSSSGAASPRDDDTNDLGSDLEACADSIQSVRPAKPTSPELVAAEDAEDEAARKAAAEKENTDYDNEAAAAAAAAAAAIRRILVPSVSPVPVSPAVGPTPGASGRKPFVRSQALREIQAAMVREKQRKATSLTTLMATATAALAATTALTAHQNLDSQKNDTSGNTTKVKPLGVHLDADTQAWDGDGVKAALDLRLATSTPSLPKQEPGTLVAPCKAAVERWCAPPPPQSPVPRHNSAHAVAIECTSVPSSPPGERAIATFMISVSAVVAGPKTPPGVPPRHNGTHVAATAALNAAAAATTAAVFPAVASLEEPHSPAATRKGVCFEFAAADKNTPAEGSWGDTGFGGTDLSAVSTAVTHTLHPPVPEDSHEGIYSGSSPSSVSGSIAIDKPHLFAAGDALMQSGSVGEADCARGYTTGQQSEVGGLDGCGDGNGDEPAETSAGFSVNSLVEGSPVSSCGSVGPCSKPG